MNKLAVAHMFARIPVPRMGGKWIGLGASLIERFHVQRGLTFQNG